MRLTNFSDYALRILMYAAAPGRPLDRHCRLMTVFAIAPPGLWARASRRPAVWAALVAAFVILALPDCCLNGRHVAGFGMDAFAFVCHGAR